MDAGGSSQYTVLLTLLLKGACQCTERGNKCGSIKVANTRNVCNSCLVVRLPSALKLLPCLCLVEFDVCLFNIALSG